MRTALWMLASMAGGLSTVSHANQLELAELLVDTTSVPVGSGHSLNLVTEDGAVYELRLSLPAASLGAGHHALHVRVRDDDGLVSPLVSQPIRVGAGSPGPRLVQAGEFWLGGTALTPGAGQALTIVIKDDTGAYVEAIGNPAVAPLSAGHHTFGARLRDTQQQWSLDATQTFHRNAATAPGVLPELLSGQAVFVGVGETTFPLSLGNDTSPRVLVFATASVPLTILPTNQPFWIFGRFSDSSNGTGERPASGFNWLDSDGDGLGDLQELLIGTNPNNPDTDGDGLSDGEELDLGTDPLNPDTDGDGVPDGQEIEDGTDPTDPTSFRVTLFRDGFEPDEP